MNQLYLKISEQIIQSIRSKCLHQTHHQTHPLVWEMINKGTIVKIIQKELETYSIPQLADIVYNYDDDEINTTFELMYFRSAKEQARRFLITICTQLVHVAVVQRLKLEFGVK